MQRVWTRKYKNKDIEQFYCKARSKCKDLGVLCGISGDDKIIMILLSNAVIYLTDFNLFAYWRDAFDDRFDEKTESELELLWIDFIKDSLNSEEKIKYDEERINITNLSAGN